ncbi:MAG: helix-turn-helix transcriptional regulator [Firmicutes bacterium]|nr:helix-turn-helix transcriptional regulator [Bacillota bacterium]
MGYLEEYEWMLLNEIVYKISFIYTFEDMEKEILLWMNNLIPYDGALITKVKVKNEQLLSNGGVSLGGIISRNIDEKTISTWERETLESDTMRWMIASGRNEAVIDKGGFSEAKWEERPIYASFYRPNQFYYSIGMVFTFKEEPVGMLKLYRKRTSGDFNDRDVFVLNQLQKHFAYRFSYETKKGDTRFFYARGYQEEICKRHNLTEREGEIFEQVIQGYSNAQIAERENVSIHTIKKHLQNIYIKMGVKNRVQLLQGLPLSTDKIDYDKL